MRPRVVSIIFWVVLCVPISVGAEEIICDPENPACAPAKKPEPPKAKPEPKPDPTPPSEPSSSESGEEIICDSENPACTPTKPKLTPKPDAEGEEVICDPENPACTPAKKPKQEAAGEEVICDPENPSCAQSETRVVKSPEVKGPKLKEESFDEGPKNVSAQFKGTYGTAMMVDTAYDRAREDIAQWQGALTLRLSYDLSTAFRVVAEAQFRYWAGGKENLRQVDWWFNAWDKRAEYDLLLGETYVLWRKDAWTLRLGNIITPWGSTDLSRPGDVINPRDFRGLTNQAPGGFEPTLAQLAVDANYIGDGWALQLLMVPFFVQDRMPVIGRDGAVVTAGLPAFSGRFPTAQFGSSVLNALFLESGQPPTLAPNTGPDELPQNVSLGARLSATFWNTDVGIGYFFGWDRTPWLEVDAQTAQLLRVVASDAQFFQDGNLPAFLMRNPEAAGLANDVQSKVLNGETIVEVESLRRHTLVLDMARYIGPIGVRWDVVMSPAQVYLSRELESIRRPTLQSALGLSYETFDDGYQLALIVEGTYTKVFAQDAGVTRWFIDETRRGAQGSQPLLINDGLYGIAAGINYTLVDWDVQAQLGGLYNISSEDWLMSMQLSKRFNTYARLTLGWMVFEGPSPDVAVTLGGLFDHQDAVFLGFDGAF